MDHNTLKVVMCICMRNMLAAEARGLAQTQPDIYVIVKKIYPLILLIYFCEIQAFSKLCGEEEGGFLSHK